MAFSLALPSFAVSEENQKLTADEAQDAFTAAVAAILDAPADVAVVVDEEVADEADTPKEIANLLSVLIFVEKDKAEEVAAAEGIDIAGDSYSAMSYSHIAGELALHMILASLSKRTQLPGTPFQSGFTKEPALQISMLTKTEFPPSSSQLWEIWL